MSEVETFHDSQTERENYPRVENSTPPNMITANDLDVVIEGWERKFEHLSQCLREIQLASEKANTTMSNIARDGRAREDIQERRIEEMHVGLTQFLERCDPAHLTAQRSVDAPAASTPFTPTGVPSRLRHDFNFESPVNQATPTESTRNRDHYDARESTHNSIDPRNIDPRNIDPHNTHPRNIDPRNRDHDDARESTRNSIDPRNIDPRNIDPRNTHPRNIDPRNQDHHDARDRSRDHRSHERPTHEDDRGDSGDEQRNSYHSGMNNSMSHPSFDGTVSAQFRPWIIQFETIARHQCWTLGERVVRLLIGMTMGQLDDYTFLVACLSRRYDPHQTPKRIC